MSMLSRWFTSDKKSSLQKGIKPNRKSGLAMEPLEERQLLSVSPNTPTGYNLHSQISHINNAAVETRLSFEFFQENTAGVAGATLGFMVTAEDGSSLDPGQIRLEQNGASLTPINSILNYKGTNSSLALFSVKPGAYDVFVQSQDGTTGAFTCEVYLPGDTNGDGVISGTEYAAETNAVSLMVERENATYITTFELALWEAKAKAFFGTSYATFLANVNAGKYDLNGDGVTSAADTNGVAKPNKIASDQIINNDPTATFIDSTELIADQDAPVVVDPVDEAGTFFVGNGEIGTDGEYYVKTFGDSLKVGINDSSEVVSVQVGAGTTPAYWAELTDTADDNYDGRYPYTFTFNDTTGKWEASNSLDDLIRAANNWAPDYTIPAGDYTISIKMVDEYENEETIVKTIHYVPNSAVPTVNKKTDGSNTNGNEKLGAEVNIKVDFTGTDSTFFVQLPTDGQTTAYFKPVTTEQTITTGRGTVTYTMTSAGLMTVTVVNDSYAYLTVGSLESDNTVILEIPVEVTDLFNAKQGDAGAWASGDFKIQLDPVNDLPTAVNDTKAVEQDEDASISVLLNDLDNDQWDKLDITKISATNPADWSEIGDLGSDAVDLIVTTGSGKTVTIKVTKSLLVGATTDKYPGDQSILSQLEIDQNGQFKYLKKDATDTFTLYYQMKDEQGETSVAALTVTVTGKNDAPTADNYPSEEIDPVETDEAANLPIDLTDYVHDEDEDAVLTIPASSITGHYTTIVTPGSPEEQTVRTAKLTEKLNALYGSGSTFAANYLTFTDGKPETGIFAPGEDFLFLGEDEFVTLVFTYKAADEYGLESNEATITLTVKGVNNAPVVGTTGDKQISLEDTDSSDFVAFNLTNDKTNKDVSDNDVNDKLSIICVVQNGELEYSDNLPGLDKPDGLDEAISWNAVDGKFEFDHTKVQKFTDLFGTEHNYFEQLPLDVTVTIPYTFTISDDYNSTTTGTLNVVITGTNQAPVVDDVDTTVETNQGVAVDVTLNDTTVDPKVIHVSDVDKTDEQTVSLSEDDAVTFVVTSSSDTRRDALTTIIDGMDLGGYVTFTGSTLDDLKAIFTPGKDFNFLGINESVTLTYTWLSTDNHSEPSATTATFKVTINGLNDQPVIDADKLLAIEINDTATTGSVAFDPATDATDEDINDTLSVADVTIALAGDVEYSGDFGLAAQPAGLDAALTWNDTDKKFEFDPSAITYTDPTGNGYYYFSQLPLGATATITYSFKVTDDSGEENAQSEKKTITVIITGTNQNPVTDGFKIDTDENTSKEGSLEDDESTYDIDKLDTLTITAGTTAPTSVVNILDATKKANVEAALTKMLSTKSKTLADFISYDGLTATFNPTYTDGENTFSYFNFLAEGESLTITYYYQVQDNQDPAGTSVEKTLEVTVTGVNNAPTITGATNNATIGTAITVNLAYTNDDTKVIVKDADVNDSTHTFLSVRTNNATGAEVWANIPTDGSTLDVYDSQGHLLGTVAYSENGTNTKALVFTPDATGDWLKWQCSDIKTKQISFEVKVSDGHAEDNLSNAATLSYNVTGNHLNPVVDAGQIIGLKAAGSDLNGDKALTAVYSPGYSAGSWQFNGETILIEGVPDKIHNDWFKVAADGTVSFIDEDMQEDFRTKYLGTTASVTVTAPFTVTDKDNTDPDATGLTSAIEHVTFKVVKKESPVVTPIVGIDAPGALETAETLSYDLQDYFTVETPKDENTTRHETDKPWYAFEAISIDSANSWITPVSGTETSFDDFNDFPMETKAEFYQKIIDAISVSMGTYPADSGKLMTESVVTLNLNDSELDSGKLFGFLAQGDVATISIKWNVIDQEYGVSKEVTSIIKITGVNDVPVIVENLGPQELIITNDDNEENPTGSLNEEVFTDPDWSDTHSLSNIAITGGKIGEINYSAAELAIYFGVSTTDLDGCLTANAGEDLGYTFNVNFKKDGVKVFQKLPDGMVAILNYSFNVMDNHNEESDAKVNGTVQINGKNQNPVVTNVPVVTTNQNEPVDIVINGIVEETTVTHVTDIDTGDTQELSLTTAPVTFTATSNKTGGEAKLLGELGSLNLTEYLQFEGTTLDDLKATFTPGTAFQFIGVGESVTLTYTWQSTDKFGGVSNSATIEVTITGTNEQPVIKSEPTITMDDTDATGSVAFDLTVVTNASDKDINDILSIENDSITMVGNVVYTGVTGLDANPAGVASALTYDPDTGEFTFDQSATTFTDLNGDSHQNYFRQLPVDTTATITYSFKVKDDSGKTNAESETGTITVVINGTNEGALYVNGYENITATVDLRTETSGILVIPILKHVDDNGKTIYHAIDADYGETESLGLYDVWSGILVTDNVFPLSSDSVYTEYDMTPPYSEESKVYNVDIAKLAIDAARLQKGTTATIYTQLSKPDYVGLYPVDIHGGISSGGAGQLVITVIGRNEVPVITAPDTAIVEEVNLASTNREVTINWADFVTDKDTYPKKDVLSLNTVNGTAVESVEVLQAKAEGERHQDIYLYDTDGTTLLGYVRIGVNEAGTTHTMTYCAKDGSGAIPEYLKWNLTSDGLDPDTKTVRFTYTVKDEFGGVTAAAKPVEVTVTGAFDALVLTNIADQKVITASPEDPDHAGYIKIADLPFYYDAKQDYDFSVRLNTKPDESGYVWQAGDFLCVNNQPSTNPGGPATVSVYVLKSAFTRESGALSVSNTNYNFELEYVNDASSQMDTGSKSFNLKVQNKTSLTVPNTDLGELVENVAEPNNTKTADLGAFQFTDPDTGDTVTHYHVKDGSIVLLSSTGKYTKEQLASVEISHSETYVDYLENDFATFTNIFNTYLTVTNWFYFLNAYDNSVSDLLFMGEDEYLDLTFQYTIDSYTTGTGSAAKTYNVDSYGTVTVRFTGTNDRPYGQTANHNSTLNPTDDNYVEIPATGEAILYPTEIDSLPWRDYDKDFLDDSSPDDDIDYSTLKVKDKSGNYVSLGIGKANAIEISDGTTGTVGGIFVWANVNEEGNFQNIGFDSSTRFASLAKDTTANVTIMLQVSDFAGETTPLDTDAQYSNLASKLNLKVTGTYVSPTFTGTMADKSGDVQGYSTDPAASKIVYDLSENFNMDGTWSLIFVNAEAQEVVLTAENLVANCPWLESFTFTPGTAGNAGTLTLQLMPQTAYKETLNLAALNLKVQLTDSQNNEAESNVFEVSCNQQETVEILAMLTNKTTNGAFPGTEEWNDDYQVQYISSTEFDNRVASTEEFTSGQDLYLELWFRDNLAKYFGTTGENLVKSGINQIQLQVNCAPVLDGEGNVLSGFKALRQNKTDAGYPTDPSNSGHTTKFEKVTIGGVDYLNKIVIQLSYNRGTWTDINYGCEGSAVLLTRLFVEYVGDISLNPVEVTVGPVNGISGVTNGYQYRLLDNKSGYTDNSQIASLNKNWKYTTTPVSGTTVTEKIVNGGLYLRTATERSTSSVVNDLPVNATYVNEWQSHFAEIWVKASDVAEITGAAVTFSYNPEYFAAATVEFEGIFDGFYSIDYEAGTVSLFVNGDTTQVDENGFILVGRVLMQADEVLAEDGTILASPTGVAWDDCRGPQSLGWALSNGFITTANRGDVTAYIGNTTSTELWGVAYDTNDDGTINTDDIANLGLFYGMSSLDGDAILTLLDFDRSGIINTDDIATIGLMYGYNRSAVAKGEQTVSFPETFMQRYVGSTLNTDGDVAWVGTVLDAANEQWMEALGLEKGVEITLVVKDLGTDDLAITRTQAVDEDGTPTAGIIYLDDDALGNTWYAQLDRGVVGSSKYDLYTVLLHELGHLYGYEGHSDSADDVMYADLQPGERKSLTAHDIALGVETEPAAAALPEIEETNSRTGNAGNDLVDTQVNVGLLAASLETANSSGVKVSAAALPLLNAMGLNIPNAEIVPDGALLSDAAVLELFDEGEDDDDEIDLLDFVSDEDAREIETSIDTILSEV